MNNCLTRFVLQCKLFSSILCKSEERQYYLNHPLVKCPLSNWNDIVSVISRCRARRQKERAVVSRHLENMTHALHARAALLSEAESCVSDVSRYFQQAAATNHSHPTFTPISCSDLSGVCWQERGRQPSLAHACVSLQSPCLSANWNQTAVITALKNNNTHTHIKNPSNERPFYDAWH